MNKKIIKSENAPKPIGAYNQAVESNGIIYFSGMIAFEPKTMELITENIEAETKQVMENIRAILKEAKLHFNNILKCSIYLKNMDDFASVNEIYGSYFVSETAPARECIEVCKLPRNVNIEISVVAARSLGQ